MPTEKIIDSLGRIVGRIHDDGRHRTGRDELGRVVGRYDLLPALLVKQAQKQAKEIGTLTAQAKRKDAQIAELRREIDALKKKDVQIDALAERMNALEQQARRAGPEHLASAMR